MTQEFKEWKPLFSYLQKVLDPNKKFYIWIDEFPYLMKTSPELPSVLQQFIDDFLRKSNIFFIISGSLFGIIREKVLSSSSPLYGRRTRDILLLPLKFNFVKEFLNWRLEDRFKLYFTIGGIPEYLLLARNYKDYTSFIESEFLNKNGHFYREPHFLLSREFKEIKTYFSILTAISLGNTTPTQIANFVGIKTREIYPYLDNLISYGFVGRMEFLFKKKSVYFVKDPFFDFWFNFVYRNRTQIELGIKELNKEVLNTYFGKRFEIFVYENLPIIFPRLKKLTKHIKTYKKNNKGLQIEIDIVALNEKIKEILFAECKWKSRVNAEKVVEELAEKARYVDWFKDKRKESYAVFAKSFSKRIKEFEGKKVYCFDLRELEKSLKNKNLTKSP